MNYVYSTLTNSNCFVKYAPKTDANALSRIVERVEIKGGHGLKNPKGMDTPRGVVTIVTDEQLKILEQCPSFNRQVEAGFITVDSKKVDAEVRAAEMAAGDRSSPITADNFEESDESTDETRIFKTKKAKK